MNYHDAYIASREKLAEQHDDGAATALRDCIEAEVDCMAYCYGGSARIAITETLAELAEQGWRLVRVDVTPSPPPTDKA